MSITIFLLFIAVNSVTSNREYVIRKDYFRFFKSAEYTVYDRAEQQVLYRLESEYGILQNVKLIAYPSKEEIGRLRAKVSLIVYQGEFSILDPQSNERRNGSINQHFKFGSYLHDIQWNGKAFHVETKAFTLTTEFREASKGELLAEYRLRPASIFVTRKYDMKIYSSKYPEALYFLGFAASERKYRKD